MSIETLTSTQVIAAMCGDRKPCECSCQHCQSMCLRTPCLGTPEDILRLVEHGFLSQLVGVKWFPDDIPPIEMVQLAHTGEDDAGGGPCPMFKAGRCSIHAIKPTEGRLANHDPCHLLDSPSLAVAMTWLLPRNRRLVDHLFSLIDSPRTQTPIPLPDSCP